MSFNVRCYSQSIGTSIIFIQWFAMEKKKTFTFVLSQMYIGLAKWFYIFINVLQSKICIKTRERRKEKLKWNIFNKFCIILVWKRNQL